MVNIMHCYISNEWYSNFSLKRKKKIQIYFEIESRCSSRDKRWNQQNKLWAGTIILKWFWVLIHYSSGPKSTHLHPKWIANEGFSVHRLLNRPLMQKRIRPLVEQCPPRISWPRNILAMWFSLGVVALEEGHKQVGFGLGCGGLELRNSEMDETGPGLCSRPDYKTICWSVIQSVLV